MPGRVTGVVAAGVALLLTPALQAQTPGQQALLEEAGQLFTMGDRAGQGGDHTARIANYRAALRLVDRAIAMEGPSAEMIVNGRREMLLSLGEAEAEARQHDDALATYSGLAREIEGEGRAIPSGRIERLHYARALRGLVDAGVNSGNPLASREALPRLIATGRAMHAVEPSNSYLTRRLAQDMQAEVIFRWVLEDGPGSAAMARETLALFRSLALSNPNSVEALGSRFLWAYGAAELTGDDIELWREAVEAGGELAGRRRLKPEHVPFLRAARSRLDALERSGR